jgi:hypothetical protein
MYPSPMTKNIFCILSLKDNLVISRHKLRQNKTTTKVKILFTKLRFGVTRLRLFVAVFRGRKKTQRFQSKKLVTMAKRELSSVLKNLKVTMNQPQSLLLSFVFIFLRNFFTIV